MRIIKLDRRHTGYSKFSYFVEPVFNVRYGKDEGLEDFLAWRTWCWQVWGPGMELRFAMENRVRPLPDVVWAWQTEFRNTKLFFKTEAEASAFVFQWDQALDLK
jgi:hypothetical protein